MVPLVSSNDTFVDENDSVESIDEAQGYDSKSPSPLKPLRHYASATLLWSETGPSAAAVERPSMENTRNISGEIKEGNVLDSSQTTGGELRAYEGGEHRRISVQSIRDSTQEMESLLSEIQQMRIHSRRLSEQKEILKRDYKPKVYRDPNITSSQEAHRPYPGKSTTQLSSLTSKFTDEDELAHSNLYRDPELASRLSQSYNLYASPDNSNMNSIPSPPRLPLPPLPSREHLSPEKNHQQSDLNHQSSKPPLPPPKDPLARRSVSYSVQVNPVDLEIETLQPSASLNIHIHHSNSSNSSSDHSNHSNHSNHGSRRDEASRSNRHRSHSHNHIPSHRNYDTQSHNHDEHPSHSNSSKTLRNKGQPINRVFSQPNVARLLAENQDRTVTDLERLQLPAKERHMIEQFVDILSKLSIEMSLDDKKRSEGRRRLNNALRALEGWI